MSPAHRWRRADGTVLSGIDLTEAVPMTLDELDDVARLLDRLEEWLRLDADARDQLSDWLTSSSCPGSVPAVWALIDQLGTVSVTLHALLRDAAGEIGHVHPPTG